MRKSGKLTLEDIGSFLAKLAEKSESVYWLSSPDFKKIQYISPAFEIIWGRPRDILYVEPELWITYLHPDDIKNYHPIHAMAERIRKEGAAARYQENYRIIRPDGEIRWIIDQGFPIYDETGNCCGVTGVAVDVTQDKLAEDTLRKAKQAAESADKAKTEFLENMRHDLRTPLAGIAGFAAILGEEADNPKIKEYASNLIASSNALLDFLNEILETIRVTSGEIPLLKKKFDLKQKLIDIINLNQARAKQKHLDLTMKYDDSIPHYFVGDPKRIQRIILELVTNALNFTEQGQIKVFIKLAKKTNHETILKFVVQDTGIGIPQDQQQEVFTRFKRLTPSYQGIYKGAGLGLAVVKQFIDDLRGEIYIESELGKGSTFTCIIPLQEALLDEPFGTESVPVKQLPEPSLYLSQILLIEDQPIAAKMAEHILVTLNCQVDHAVDGKTALEFSNQKRYDLIFMDIGLPDMSGYEVTQRIRSNEANKNTPVPIIALTAHVDSENKQHCVEVGMNAVLSKPLTKEVANDILNAFIPTRTSLEVKLPKKQVIATAKAATDLFVISGPVIDVKAGIALSNGSEDLYREMLRMLIDSLPQDLEIITIAYQKQQWETVRSTVHKVKSGAIYCATPRLADASAKLDNYIRTGATALIPKLYQQFLQEVKALQENYQNISKNDKQT